MEKYESESSQAKFSQNNLATFINDTFCLLEEKSTELDEYTQNQITLKAKISDAEEKFDQEVSKNRKETAKNDIIITQLKEKIANLTEDKLGPIELQTLEESTFQDENKKNESSILDQSYIVGKKSSVVVHEEKFETKTASSRYECKDCDKTYANPESLRRHLKKNHLERETLDEYSCFQCKKKFQFKEDLTCHMRIHQKKVDCNICDAKFTRSDNLLKHIRKMHNEAEA